MVFGVVGVALPLTTFSGDDQLHSVLDGAGTTLGLGLLVAVLIAKMLTYAVSQSSGFVGGPLFPALFLGGTAGVNAAKSRECRRHKLFPQIKGYICACGHSPTCKR